jgi:hypothetical protein
VRFDHHADDRAGASRYLHERAYQTLIDGFHPERDELEVLATEGGAGVEWGVRGRARDPGGASYQSVYIYASARGRGLSARAFAGGPPVVTTPGCQLEAFLLAKRIPHVVAARITETAEYLAIEREYGTQTAKRSGVLLVRHIDEGLAVLQRIGAPEAAMRAYCLHPLLQEDAAHAANLARVTALTTPHVLALALEYRRVANATLSTRPIGSAADIPLSAMPEVNQMLVADKVQNRKDFLLHHHGRHPRSDALDRYFRLWLERLDVPEARFAALFDDLQVTTAPTPLASLRPGACSP